MKMKLELMKVGATAIALVAAMSGSWAAGPEDLGKSLTPSGAEMSGNSDGTIPAWTGAEPPRAGWSYGKNRKTYWPHSDDKPLFIIDASNVDKYADHLTVGEIALLKTKKGYTMPVYPTHRDCGIPDFVAKNTVLNAQGRGKIGADGWSLEDAALPGIPFPFPKTGIEAIWNWLTKYQGVGNEEGRAVSYLSAPPGSGRDGLAYVSNDVFFYPNAQKGTFSPKDNGGVEIAGHYNALEPASQLGFASNQTYYYNKDNESYAYFPGQRRVRRQPSYGYDAPIIGFENQYPVDDQQVFYGNPDRYNWKLVGKKELYVSYNNFLAWDSTGDYKQDLGPDYVKPSGRRYELHRVWVLEATVKDGVRHSAPKRTVYLDEDSWMTVAGEDYDAKGNLWRVHEASPTPAYELGACVAGTYVFNDLISGRYVWDQIWSGQGTKDTRFFTDRSQDPRLSLDWFSPENLRAISER
ncbi:DUF1329 domain-containing protein [Paraburkholderia sp. BL27I4N3]|uniref:DUF1329 domain-containing protein n=1 Tax=Paraburkholderia sp. BL27I4N3 TaxID=1938805 RepID=UPI000E24DF7E|nr:DUF1329 domain-containing protein [Paraburkholderia sp. BL27I4N3]